MKIEINKENFMRYLEIKRWSISKAAREMDVDKSYLTRVLKGERSPGNKFIASALAAFTGLTFDELFICDTRTNDLIESQQENIV